MDFNVQSGRLAANGLRVTMLAAAVALAGCGGGGSSGSVNNAGTTPVNTTPTTPTKPVSQYSLSMAASQPSLKITGDTVVVTLKALDRFGGGVANQSITLKLPDVVSTGLSITGPSTQVSNDQGEVSFTLKMVAGGSVNTQNLLEKGIVLQGVLTEANGAQAQQVLMLSVVQPGAVASQYKIDIATDKDVANVKGDTLAVTVHAVDSNGGSAVAQSVTLALPNLIKGVSIKGIATTSTDASGNATFTLNIASNLDAAATTELLKGFAIAAKLVEANGSQVVATKLISVAQPTSQFGLSIRTDSTTGLNVYGDTVKISVQASGTGTASPANQTVQVSLNADYAGLVGFEGATKAQTDANGIATFTLKVPAGLSASQITDLLSKTIGIGASLVESSGAETLTATTLKASRPVVKNSIRLETSKNVLVATGDTMTIKTMVLDANNGGVAGQNVTLKLNAAAGVVISGPSTQVSDAKGQVVFSVVLSDKLSPAEKDALLQSGVSAVATLVESTGASVSTAPTAIAISNAGTNQQSSYSVDLRFSKQTLNVYGDTFAVTVLARDNKNFAVANQSIQLGLPALAGLTLLSPATATTNATGQATFNLSLDSGLTTAERQALLNNGLSLAATLTEPTGATKTVQQTLAAIQPAARYTLAMFSSASPLNARGDSATVSVQATDNDNKLAENQRIRLRLTGASATLLNLNGQAGGAIVEATTDANGIAKFAVAVPSTLTATQRQTLIDSPALAVASLTETGGTISTQTLTLGTAEPTSQYNLKLNASKVSVNAGGDSFTVIANVSGANASAAAGQKLNFALSAPALAAGVQVNATDSTTNASGDAIFTVTVPKGSDLSALNGMLSYAVVLTEANGALTAQSGNVSLTSPAVRYGLTLSADRVVKTSGDTFKVFARAVNSTGGSVAGQTVRLAVADPIKTGVTITGSAAIVTDANGLAVFDLKMTPGANVNQALLTSGVMIGAVLEEDNGSVSKQALIVPVDTINTTGQYLLSWTQSKKTFTGFGDEIALTYRVTDANGGILTNVPVHLRIKDALLSGAILTTPSTLVTDDNGFVTTKVKLVGRELDAVLGDDISLLATVEATTFDANGQPSIQNLAEQNVILSKSGPADLSVSTDRATLRTGEAANITVKLKDNAGDVVANAPVILVDANANDKVISTAAVLTNDQGEAVFSVPYSSMTFNSLGRSSIVAIVNGAKISKRSIALTIVSATDSKFSFTNLPNKISNVNALVPATVRIRALTASALNGSLQLATSLGRMTVDPAVAPISNVINVTLDRTAQGMEGGMFYRDVTVYVQTAYPGTAVVTGNYTVNGVVDSISADLKFRANMPAKLMLQADETVLTPNQSTRIFAVVKDSNDSPVSGAVVRFERLVDTSAGRLSASTAVTDDSGVASVVYTAGTSAPVDRVEINASVESSPDIAPQPGVLTLTVAEQAAYITVGSSDRLTKSPDNIYYYHPYSMTVVDGSGKPVQNQTVSLRIFANNFAKGFFSYTAPKIQVISGEVIVTPAFFTQNAVSCATEDQNRNFTLDAGEDRNLNGQLEVRNPVAIIKDGAVSGDGNNIVTFTTDAEGKFDFKLRYAKIYAQWMTVEMKATTRVFGSEMASITINKLPILVDDVDLEKGIIPNKDSPFGTTLDCTAAN